MTKLQTDTQDSHTPNIQWSYRPWCIAADGNNKRDINSLKWAQASSSTAATTQQTHEGSGNMREKNTDRKHLTVNTWRTNTDETDILLLQWGSECRTSAWNSVFQCGIHTFPAVQDQSTAVSDLLSNIIIQSNAVSDHSGSWWHDGPLLPVDVCLFVCSEGGSSVNFLTQLSFSLSAFICPCVLGLFLHKSERESWIKHVLHQRICYS